MKSLLIALMLTYVMPAGPVLRRLANARDEMTLTALKTDGLAAVSPVMAKEVASALGASWNSGDLSLSASVTMRFPGRCRLDLTSSESNKTLTTTWASGKKRQDGGAFQAARVAVDEFCAVLSIHSGSEGESRAALTNHLGSLKVDTKQSSLGRFAGTIAYVLGDRAEGAPQFWVYKDKMQPARVRFTDDTKAQWDVRFLDYTSQATGDFFPRIIEVYKGTELHLRLTVLGADTRPEVDAVQF